MSMHEIPARDSKYEVVVGWDQPMNTYFAHVKDTTISEGDEEERDLIVLWLGGTFDEILTVSLLSTKLYEYAEITGEMVRTLFEDKQLRRM